MAKKSATPRKAKAPAYPFRLEWRTPEELADNPSNWRDHPEAQTAALDGVLTQLAGMPGAEPGSQWAGALAYNERTERLIDGHARKKVPPELMVGGKVPVLVGSWTEEQERFILATLDPLAAMAEANEERLAELLRTSPTDDPAVQAMLDELAADAGILGDDDPGELEDVEPQLDRAEELRAEWGTEAGQLWEVVGEGGTHRVLCGDCRAPADMARLCGSEKINVAFTSPPYASQRKYDESSGFNPIPPDEYVDWWEPVQANVREHLAADGSFFVNIKPHCEDGERVLYVFDLVLRMKRGWGWRFVDDYCWKRRPIPMRCGPRFKNGWEPVFHFSHGDPKVRHDHVMIPSDGVFTDAGPLQVESGGSYLPGVKVSAGMALPSNVIECSSSVTESQPHTAQYPIGLPSFFIRAFSDEGDVICDSFMGSGSTCIAADQHGRRSFGCEISPAYVAVILQRCTDAGMAPRLVE